MVKCNKILVKTMSLVLSLYFLCATADGYLFNSSSSDNQQQDFWKTPQNVTATVGDKVILTCGVKNKAGDVQWTRDGLGLGTEDYIAVFKRYKMLTSKDNLSFMLEINPVNLEDDGMYQCQVSPKFGHKGIRTKDAKLTVEVPTSRPVILNGDIMYTTEGKKENLVCVSKGGKPPAAVTWLDNFGRAINSAEYVDTNIEPAGDENGKLFNTRGTLRLQISRPYHNHIFSCQVQNQKATKLTTHIRLDVKYAPKVFVKIEPIYIKEFDNVSIFCLVDANPPNILSYKWFINDIEQYAAVGNWGHVFSLGNVSRTFNDKIVKCQVQNAIGWSNNSEKLSIAYGPVFRSRPKNVYEDMNATVTLSCDVDSNPLPTVSWRYNRIGEIVNDKANYSLAVNRDTEGIYVCQAFVQGFPTVHVETFVYLKGPPRIVSRNVQYTAVKDEETIRVECVAISIPPPVDITWKIGDKIIQGNESGQHYSIFEEHILNGKRSVLTVPLSEKTDSSFAYNCTATNLYGQDILEIFLFKPKNKEFLVIIGLVFGGVVTLIGTLITVLLCRNKPKLKQAPNESKEGSLSKKFLSTSYKNDSMNDGFYDPFSIKSKLETSAMVFTEKSIMPFSSSSSSLSQSSYHVRVRNTKLNTTPVEHGWVFSEGNTASVETSTLEEVNANNFARNNHAVCGTAIVNTYIESSQTNMPCSLNEENDSDVSAGLEKENVTWSCTDPSLSETNCQELEGRIEIEGSFV